MEKMNYGHTPDGYCSLKRVRELIDADRMGLVLILKPGQQIEYVTGNRIRIQMNA